MEIVVRWRYDFHRVGESKRVNFRCYAKESRDLQLFTSTQKRQQLYKHHRLNISNDKNIGIPAGPVNINDQVSNGSSEILTGEERRSNRHIGPV